MGLNKFKLSEFIEVSDLRNTDKSLTEDDVVGLSTQKQMIKTKADLEGVNLGTYKVLKPGYFAYVPDTSRRGDKMSMAYNDTENTFIVSSISIVFYVKEPEKLDPIYLFMYFKRPEFDRYARFNSWGSARETFDWKTMCDITIELPPINIQRKFAKVYLSMVENQKAYEQGLEDLKLTCEAEINEIKHTAQRVTTKELLMEVDNRNTDEAIKEIHGINITKSFMPSVASVNEGSIKNYKLVKNGQFAYSSMQTGRDECIRIALYDGEMPIIVSPAYSVLEVKSDKAVAEYIMLWFSRKEIDRYGAFCSDASIRANLDLKRFYEFEIPLPSVGKQKAIAKIYKAYTMRKETNEQLKAQIKDICPILIKGSLEEVRA
ncbi:MAG: restriction endonuclease subunit S [Clostridia bacterium]|nr:restriction endonuclease subunit S [Clostridia bacterium]